LGFGTFRQSLVCSAMKLFALSWLLSVHAVLRGGQTGVDQAALTTASSSTEEAQAFAAYVARFGKRYQPAEYKRRAGVFAANRQKVLEHNAHGSKAWSASVNKFADWTEEEFRALHGVDTSRSTGKTLATTTAGKLLGAGNATKARAPLPASVDWRKKGVLTPVPDQGRCGSCWAVTAAGVIEAHLSIATQQSPKRVSAGQMRDCVPNPQHCGGTGGCKGAVSELAFEWTADQGVAWEHQYPYQEAEAACGSGGFNGPGPVVVSGYKALAANDQYELMEALTVGPVKVSVAVPSYFAMYQGGVLSCDNSEDAWILGHAMIAVGYGTDPVFGGYWILRNSWGDDWGESGFMRLKREADASAEPCGEDTDPKAGYSCKPYPEKLWVCGHCGVLAHSSYPTGVGLREAR